MKNYRVRQLIDGRWIGEVDDGFWFFSEWKAVDSSGYCRSSGSAFYIDCICDTEEEAKRNLALFGI